MYKKIIILTVALFISITATVAGNGKSIHSVISSQLKVPQELKSSKLNEKVNVQFKIKENGEVTVLNVETSNPQLKSYIMNQFPKIDFKAVAEKQDAGTRTHELVVSRISFTKYRCRARTTW